MRSTPIICVRFEIKRRTASGCQVFFSGIIKKQAHFGLLLCLQQYPLVLTIAKRRSILFLTAEHHLDHEAIQSSNPQKPQNFPSQNKTFFKSKSNQPSTLPNPNAFSIIISYKPKPHETTALFPNAIYFTCGRRAGLR